MRAVSFLAFAAVATTGCKRSEPAESAPQEVEPADAAGAEAEVEEATGDERAPVITSPFLYEVTTPDGEEGGYLFGTMHMGVDAEASLPDIVWERLEAADTFAMEADLTDMSIAGRLIREDGTTLSDEIGEEAWKKLVEIVGPMQANGFDKMKPAAAAMAVIAEPLPMTPPMDLVMLQRAKEAELEIVYLEEASFQIDLLLRYITTGVLLELLEDYEQVVEMSEKGIQAYLAGDEATMAEFLLDPANWEQTPEGAKEALLDQRNQNWLPRVEELVTSSTPFIAVGAGHLIGEGSVVDLLRDEGYEVTRLEAE